MPSADIENQTPFFSIVMPTYNRANLIHRGIESVLRQTFGSWELIVVDDGGSDNTRKVVEQFRDRRIRYFWKRNEERSKARNYGIEHARGAYINFLDSDDFHKPRHLEAAHEIVSCNTETNVLHMGYVTIDSSTGMEKEKIIPNTSDVLGQLIADNPLNCNAMFVRREAFSEFRFLDSKDAVIGEDWYVWLRLAARYRFHFATEVTTCVVNHGNRSIAHIDPYRYERSYNVIIEELIKDPVLKQTLGPARFRRLIAYQTLGIGQHFLINMTRSKRRAARHMGQSVMISPSMVFTKRFLVCFKKLLTPPVQ